MMTKTAGGGGRLAWVLGCAAALAASHACAAPAVTDMVVHEIFENGTKVDSLEGDVKVQGRSPSGTPLPRIDKGQVLPPGTQLGAGPAVLIELRRASPPLSVRIEPRTRITVVRSDANGASVDVLGGQAGFSLTGRLNFYFGVTAFQKVLALARGTQFSVDANRSCIGGADAPCVTVRLDEGRLNLETRRPVLLGPAARPPSASGEDETVVVVDPMNAGETRLLSLEPEKFALQFDTPQAAEAHFAQELEKARSDRNPLDVLRALRNLLVIHRLNDRHEDALMLAEEGIRLARRESDRLWEFRFLIDEAFTTWRLKRDRSAFDLFDRAFGMTDVIEAVDARTDLAALYSRYGNIRFDARNRSDPRPDIDVAEDYARRSLQLREAQAGDRPSLDLSMSHYGLGMLLRIGREDAVQASTHLERALEIRRQVLGRHDDVSTAEMMAEAALTSERVVSQGAPRCPAPGLDEPFRQVRLQFEESAAMLSRLSPDSKYRSYPAVVRRMADFRRRVGEWLEDHCRSPAAADEFRAAQADYERAIDEWARQPGNTLAERRFAFRGLGQTRLRLKEPGEAARALQQAYGLAIEERCATPPGLEAPSFKWIGELLELLAQSAAASGTADAAAAYRRTLSDVESVCRATTPREPLR